MSDQLRQMFRAMHPAAWRAHPDHSQAAVDLTPRLAAADLLDEHGRAREAAILRDLRRHAYLDFGGRVEDAGDLVQQLNNGIHPRSLMDNFTRRYVDAALDDLSATDPMVAHGARFEAGDVGHRTLAAMIADAHHIRAMHEDEPRVANTPAGEMLHLSRHYPSVRTPDPSSGRADLWFGGLGWADHPIHEQLHDYAESMGPYPLRIGDAALVTSDAYKAHNSDALPSLPPDPPREDTDMNIRPNRPVPYADTPPPPPIQWGNEPWESIVNDPDVDNRIHNHPVGLAKGHQHYNGGVSGTQHLVNHLNQMFPGGLSPSLVVGRGPTGEPPAGDVTITPDHLAKAQRMSGRKVDPSLAGTVLRFSTFRDKANRSGHVSHVFPPGQTQEPVVDPTQASRYAYAVGYAAPPAPQGTYRYTPLPPAGGNRRGAQQQDPTGYDDAPLGSYPAYPGMSDPYLGSPVGPMPGQPATAVNPWGQPPAGAATGPATTPPFAAAPPNPAPDGYGHTDPMGHQYAQYANGPDDDGDDDPDDTDLADTERQLTAPADTSALHDLMAALTQAMQLLQQAGCGAGGCDTPYGALGVLGGRVGASGTAMGMLNARYNGPGCYDEADNIPWDRVPGPRGAPVARPPLMRPPLPPGAQRPTAGVTRAQGGNYPKTPPTMYPTGRFPGGRPLQAGRYGQNVVPAGCEGPRYRGPGY